ncbi:MAG TPA: alcohol dehydrogenase catalytic domain-containing protein [Pseudolysinimonas sp.]|nr:alcohol dehydrogenase catalytic domain-containing protein [Pseudolysinimonas sp.]
MIADQNAAVRYGQAGELLGGTESPRRGLAADEVRVAPAYVGICGTDLHIYLGHMDGRVAPGTVLGHESSGIVTEVGAGVEGWAPGDHVCVDPVVSCGVCRTCRTGLAHVCPDLKILGIDADGAMQGDWIVPARNLVRIGADVDLRTAGLIEPLAVAVHDVRRSRLVANERALIVGAGPVGLLIAMTARDAGAQVQVVEVNEHRRAIARSLGFDATAPDELVARADADNAPDVAFEVSGAAAGLTTAYTSLTPGGRMVVVGIHSEPRELDLRSLFEREVEILGARLYAREDFERAVGLVESGRVDPAPLISDIVGFGSAGRAFDRLLASGTEMKILLSATPPGA